jgi:hypothetical protein
MKAFWWKLQYSYFLWQRIRPRVKALWINASEGHEWYLGATPLEAVAITLGDPDVVVHNARVDAKKAKKKNGR